MRDRRRYPRHASWFPVQVDRWFQRGLLGCCIDGSASGMQFRCPTQLTVGETVKLTFKVVPTQHEWITVDAEVIRADRMDGSDDPWPVQVAVHFAEAIPKLEMLFQIADDRREKGDPRQRRKHSDIRRIQRRVTENGVEVSLVG